MLGGCHPLLLVLVVVLAVSNSSDSIVDLEISRVNASSAVISRWRQLAVVEDRPVCLIVAYDKIKGHLNWMQVRSKLRKFVNCLQNVIPVSLLAGLVSESGQRAVSAHCLHNGK
jgi:hypothetical protein